MNSPFPGFKHAVRSSVPLAPYTSFRIGGPAQYLVEPRNLDELARLVRGCVRSGIPIHILGGGSNLLVADHGVAGAIFRLTQLSAISRSGNRITCEAGASLPRLLRKAEQWGLAGLEVLAGIPGTVGGAVAMNAGGRHGCIGSVVRSATTLDRQARVHERAREELGFDYRCSNLRDEVVLAATFELVERDPVEVASRRVAILEDKAKTQPLTAWSAGCVFRNPDDLGAGALIDRAGLKGTRVGHALVSARHANFIINEGGASASDVTALIHAVQEKVRSLFAVDLELEIEVWN